MKKMLFFGFGMLLFSCGNPSAENEQSRIIDSLENEIEELKEANDTLSDHLMQRRYATKIYPAFFDSIAQPEQYLLNTLQEKKELIPKDAVLGGEMRFTNISFINEDLFLAEYEDGHVMGKAIYTYRIGPDGIPEYELETVIE